MDQFTTDLSDFREICKDLKDGDTSQEQKIGEGHDILVDISHDLALHQELR
jgi:hypothetical protein